MPAMLSRSAFLRLVRDGAGWGFLSTIAPARAQEKESRGVPFGDAAPGALPAGFTAALTGGGGPVAWQVREDASVAGGRVLAQTSADPTDARFPLCIYDRVSARDIDVSVRFKPVSGRVDRAGGLVVRLADANNYLVVRANALEDNVRLYRVVRGHRVEFAGANAKVESGSWQSLRLRAEDRRFTVFFEDRRLFSATDDTFSTPGRIGLWTKADSVTFFDRLTYTLLGA